MCKSFSKCLAVQLVQLQLAAIHLRPMHYFQKVQKTDGAIRTLFEEGLDRVSASPSSRTMQKSTNSDTDATSSVAWTSPA